MKKKNNMNKLVLFVGVFLVFTLAYAVSIHSVNAQYDDYITWSNWDSECSYTVIDGMRDCYAIINISNPTASSITVTDAFFEIDDKGYPLEYYVFNPHYVDKYDDCPDQMVASTCKWKDNGTVIWVQEQVREDWQLMPFSTVDRVLRKNLTSFNLPAGFELSIKIRGKKEVGSDVKWTFCWNGHCLDPLWSDPAGDAQGWYNFPNEFNVIPIGAGETKDDVWGNSSGAGRAGGTDARCDRRAPGEDCESFVWLGGFTEGWYTLVPTGYGGVGDLRNVTIEVPDDGGDWVSVLTSCVSGGGSYYCNWTEIPIHAYVNATGVLNFRLVANTSNTADLKAIGALHITNYTVGTPPDTTEPYFDDQTTNFTEVYGMSGATVDYEFNISAYDADSSVDSAMVCHEIGQAWGCQLMTNNSATNFYTTVIKSAKANTTYEYQFFVNDTAGNFNWSGNYTVLVNRRPLYGDGNFTININDTESEENPISYNYGNWTNASAFTEVTGTTGIVLWRNGVVQSGANQIVLLGAGTWNYTAQLFHENYSWTTGPYGGSPTYTTVIVNIVANATGLDLAVTPSETVVEGTEITASCTAITGSVNLYFDGVLVGSPYVITPSIGEYNVTCISEFVGNYTPLYETIDLNVVASGYGCTNTTTYAFGKNFTNIASDLYALDFTSLVTADLVKADLADVIVDNNSIETFVNFTSGYFFIVNTTDNPNFTVYFGNYYNNNTYEVSSYTNDTNMSGYTNINTYYTISMFNEITGGAMNPSNATETMTIYCSGGSTTFTIQNNTVDFTLATVERPDSLRMTVAYSNTEQYWREQLVRGGIEYKYFYLADANTKQVAEVLIDIEDYTGTYGQGDLLSVKKMISGSLQVITEGYFDVEAKTINYLIAAEKYQLYIDNNITETSVGELLVDTNDLTKTIIIGEFALTDELLGHIQYNLTFNNDTGAIQFFFYDPTNTTLNVTMEIWNYSNNSLLYFTYSENHTSVNFNYVVPDVNQSYKVAVHVAHTYFGENSFLDLVRIFTGLATQIINPFGSIPTNVMIGIGTVSLIGIAITFGGRQGALSGIVVGITALLYAFVGWYSVPIGIIVLALVLAIMNKFREVKS